jgi:hypothetical protein
MQPMPGGNLLHWIRSDPSVEEERSEDDQATIVVCMWMQRVLDRTGMKRVVRKMWQCMVRPYLDSSLSTSPAGAVRVDGPAPRARAA